MRWYVEPGNIEQLAETITYARDNPAQAAEIGLRARQRCIQEYSHKRIGKTLWNIFQKYEKIIC